MRYVGQGKVRDKSRDIQTTLGLVNNDQGFYCLCNKIFLSFCPKNSPITDIHHQTVILLALLLLTGCITTPPIKTFHPPQVEEFMKYPGRADYIINSKVALSRKGQ